MQRRALFTAGTAAAVTGAMAGPALFAPAAEAHASHSFIPNVGVVDQDGQAYRFYDDLCSRHNLSIGKHADWFEALLFTAAGGTRLEPAAVPAPTSTPEAVPGIPGIPLEHRSCRGVLGTTEPPPEAEGLGDTLWNDLMDRLHDVYRAGLTRFRERFSPTTDRPS